MPHKNLNFCLDNKHAFGKMVLKMVLLLRRRIIEALERTASDGFDAERVQSVLHLIELGQKHVTTGRGLNLGQRLAPVWMHGGDPIDALRIDQRLETLALRMAEEPYLETLVRRWLLENPHRLDVVMEPDDKFIAQQEAAESEKLEEIRSKLDATGETRLVREASKLLAMQDEEADPSCLPTLTPADIPRAGTYTDVENSTINGVPTQWCDQPTNGVIYIKLWFDAKQLPEELRPLFPLFSTMLGSVGAGGLDYRELAASLEAC
eukprot:SAG31_NODE_13708_length_852_cov_0.978752_1_plen_263_part_10